MKIFVKVKTGQSENKIESIGPNEYLIKTKMIAEKGLANKDIIEQLADYYQVTKDSVTIKSGFGSSKKMIEIER